MSEITITNDNFKKEVLESDKPVLVDFWAAWCGPCQMLGPVLSQVAEEHVSDLKVGKVNVDEQPELAAMFSVSSIPNIILFKNGKAVKNAVGYKAKAELEEFIK